MDFPAGYVVGPGHGAGDGDPGMKASARATGGSISVFETTVETGPSLHVHDREDECFYVLAGSLWVRCGDDVFTAETGSFVFLPRGRAHRFRAETGPARVLLIAVPGGIEDYFAEMHATDSDAERLRIREAHGIHQVPE